VREPDAFYDRLAQIVLEDDLKITGFGSPDNNLESVFRYLVEN
jgi:ABC-2 type transport system ATP-binding protein